MVLSLCDQCLISRQRRLLNSEIGGKFTTAQAYEQSYPQKLWKDRVSPDRSGAGDRPVRKISSIAPGTVIRPLTAAEPNSVTGTMGVGSARPLKTDVEYRFAVAVG